MSAGAHPLDPDQSPPEQRLSGAEVRIAEDAAIAHGFADCEALVVAMARQLGEDLESGKVVVPGDHPNGGLIASWAVNSFALAVNLGQHRTAECNEQDSIEWLRHHKISN